MQKKQTFVVRYDHRNSLMALLCLVEGMRKKRKFVLKKDILEHRTASMSTQTNIDHSKSKQNPPKTRFKSIEKNGGTNFGTLIEKGKIWYGIWLNLFLFSTRTERIDCNLHVLAIDDAWRCQQQSKRRKRKERHRRRQRTFHSNANRTIKSKASVICHLFTDSSVSAIEKEQWTARQTIMDEKVCERKRL